MNLTFPDDQDLPAFSPEPLPHYRVSRDIGSELPFPEIDSALGVIAESTSSVAMPEASMHKNDRSIFRKNNVRLAEDLSSRREPKTKSQAMKRAADCAFRSSVATSNPRHVPTSMFEGEVVHGVPYMRLRTSAAIFRASSGGTALPTWMYCAVRGPSKK